jgi:hypothetical protein
MDPDPDPSIFVLDLHDANKKLILKNKFFCLLLFEGTFTLLKSKEVTKQKEAWFFLLFFLDDR